MGVGGGGVVRLLHHETWRAWPVLHSDFPLVSGQAVGDQLVPWFLGSPAGSTVGPAADQGQPGPLLSGMEGTCEGGLHSRLLP